MTYHYIGLFTYQHAPYILESLEALIANIDALQPENVRVKLFIHDDHSTDGTLTLIQERLRSTSIHVHYLPASHEKLPFGSIRNHVLYAIEKEKTNPEHSFITLLDGDDILEKNVLLKRHQYFSTHPECTVISGWMNHFHHDDGIDNGHPLRFFQSDRTLQRLYSLFECNTYGSNTSIRCSAWQNDGDTLYFPKASIAEDWQWFVRLDGVFYVQPEVTVHYRRHFHNLTGQYNTDVKGHRYHAKHFSAKLLGVTLTDHWFDMIEPISWMVTKIVQNGDEFIIDDKVHLPWFRPVERRSDYQYALQALDHLQHNLETSSPLVHAWFKTFRALLMQEWKNFK